jgi:ABC-type anion transport system duplicated permease subunit
MLNQKTMSPGLTGATRIATVILIASAMILIASRQIMANSEMAKKTGQPCTQCHTAPPALNDYGKTYKASLKK